jgi:hypothetical protein
LVNASLNWASIVGIVLAVGGAFLYFMRNFKPALARDYDVFFAAIGLLCGGILFFQGWRLDPILQFGQFLLAGTTVFFAYESVRLRGVTTEQARRSTYFDEEEPAPFAPRGGFGGRNWEGESFDAPDPYRQRIPSREQDGDDDFYRPRRPASRAAIPERALSRRSEPGDWEGPSGGRPEPQAPEREARPSRYGATAARTAAPDFGARRREREGGEVRRGSRPVASGESMPRSSRRPGAPTDTTTPSGRTQPPAGGATIPQGTPTGTYYPVFDLTDEAGKFINYTDSVVPSFLINYARISPPGTDVKIQVTGTDAEIGVEGPGNVADPGFDELPFFDLTRQDVDHAEVGAERRVCHTLKIRSISQ